MCWRSCISSYQSGAPDRRRSVTPGPLRDADRDRCRLRRGTPASPLRDLPVEILGGLHSDRVMRCQALTGAEFVLGHPAGDLERRCEDLASACPDPEPQQVTLVLPSWGGWIPEPLPPGDAATRGRDTRLPRLLNKEWVEITNNTRPAVNLDGWTLKSEDGHTYTFRHYRLEGPCHGPRPHRPGPRHPPRRLPGPPHLRVGQPLQHRHPPQRPPLLRRQRVLGTLPPRRPPVTHRA